MWPIAALAVGSGIAQFMNGENARDANEKELAQMRALMDSIKQPNFDSRGISPAEIKILQKYIPQVAQYVQEQAPQLIKGDSADAQTGRKAQLDALERFKGLSQTGTDQYSNALNQEALRAAQIQNQGQQQAILQGMARRGAGAGSGLQFAAQLNAQQSANNTGANAALDAAKNAYQTRLQALAQSASLGGDIRNQDVNMESQNAAAINAFNARNAASQNAYGQYAADTQNRGQLYNIDQAQSAANSNEQNRYNEAVRQQGVANQNNQQRFNNDMSKATGQANVSQAAMQQNNQNAQDRNNAIAGVAGGVGQAWMYGNNQSNADREYELKKKMAGF